MINSMQAGIGALALLLGWSVPVQAQRVALSIPLNQRGYEEIAHRKGVTVYRSKSSNIIDLGAEARFNASPDQVLRVLLDYEGQVGAIARLSESKVLSRSRRSLLVYQRLNLPVISDRDFNLKVAWWRDRDTTWVTYQATRKKGRPPRDGVVRVTHHLGSWQLKPISGGRQTLARFQVRIDMSGWVPRWLARSGSGKEVPELFVAIDKMIRRSSYRSDACSSKCL